MDTAQFLQYILAPGNFACLTFQGEGKKMGTRFFPRDRIAEAAGFARWAAGQRMDVWYGAATYKLASAGPDGKYRNGSERTVENAQTVRSFWFDADIKRAGDNKKAGKAYADLPALVAWIKDFAGKTGIPLPNFWVGSGYGMHLYWVVQDPMPIALWRPYAEALKAALHANGALGDLGITTDAARLLRPAGTWNLKVPTDPKAVAVQRQRGDFLNEDLFARLRPYLTQPVAMPQAVNYGSLDGPAPSVATQYSGSDAAAAADGLTTRREHLFARIAQRCGQVKESLATGGDGDSRQLWYLGHLSLAHFCADGAEYAHRISSGDPRYRHDETEKARAQIATEHDTKGTGAPTCAFYNTERAGICPTCPHFGKINTPYSLGVEDGDLPPGYRRHNGTVQYKRLDDKESIWVELAPGDVYGPRVDVNGNIYSITFTYEQGGRKHNVLVDTSIAPGGETGKIISYYNMYGINLDKNRAGPWGIFVVAWINHLRNQQAVRANAAQPFGWVRNAEGEIDGLAVGGSLYRSNGAIEPVLGGDPRIVAMYQPRGSLDAWREAANFVLKDRIELQAIASVSFGAPLMEFTGHSGAIVSAWSRGSAVGKTSAMRVGTTVWAEGAARMDQHDTPNSVHMRIGMTKLMPAYWDEIDIDEASASEKISTFFRLSQGRDKARLNSDASLKDAGSWKTILMLAGNRPVMDYVIKERGHTDAGAVRLFEFSIERPNLPLDIAAQQRVDLTDKNCGHAGRVYAEWLAQHHAEAAQLVSDLSTRFSKVLSAETSERFYIASMACMVAGAQLARRLGLVEFDTKALVRFLMEVFNRLRIDRAGELPMHQGLVDLETILGAFVSEHRLQTLVSNIIPAQGRVPTKFRYIREPHPSAKMVLIHIGCQNREMRIVRAAWKTWCMANNLSPSDLLTQMTRRWAAYVQQGRVASGTPWVTGRIPHIVLPLKTKRLERYADPSNYGSSDSSGQPSPLDGRPQ